MPTPTNDRRKKEISEWLVPAILAIIASLMGMVLSTQKDMASKFSDYALKMESRVTHLEDLASGKSK